MVTVVVGNSGAGGQWCYTGDDRSMDLDSTCHYPSHRLLRVSNAVSEPNYLPHLVK